MPFIFTETLTNIVYFQAYAVLKTKYYYSS